MMPETKVRITNKSGSIAQVLGHDAVLHILAMQAVCHACGLHILDTILAPHQALPCTLLLHGSQLLETCALLPRLRIILRTYLTCGKSCIQTLPVLLFPWQQDIIAQTRRESTGLTINSANRKAYTYMRAQQ